MLPGKKYTPEDIVRILRRRVWWLVVPLAVISAGTALFVRTLPDLYRSETVILVVPQRVPESYVRSTVTTRIEDRLQSISQEILSRTRLEQLIQQFDLYPEERRVGIMEDIVQRMRDRDIQVRVQQGDAFSVSYVGRDPRTVQQVTQQLASFFINESVRDRQVLADGTNQFLEMQLKEARERLLEHEKKLEAFRQRYAGELPSQVGANLQAVGSLQVQMQSLLQQIDRDQERRITLERQLGELEAMSEPVAVALPAPPPVTTEPGAAADEPGRGTAAEQLAAARAALTAARLRLTEQHPDVQRLIRRIRDLEAQAEKEALQVPVSAAVPRSPAEAARQRRIAEIREELANIDNNIAQMRKEEERLRAASNEYQARAQAAPVRESELTELMRDYGPLQQLYSSLLAKKEDARIAANLEQVQIGEQFRVVDPARLPERPFSPDRPLLTLFGLAAGLGLGVVLVGLLEYRDRTLKTDEDVALILSLPVLAVVPQMVSDQERRRLRRRRLLLNAGLGAGVMGCFAALVYTLIA